MGVAASNKSTIPLPAAPLAITITARSTMMQARGVAAKTEKTPKIDLATLQVRSNSKYALRIEESGITIEIPTRINPALHALLQAGGVNVFWTGGDADRT